MKNPLLNKSAQSIFLFLSLFSSITLAEDVVEKPVTHYLQEHDWVQLSSGEWLQGKIISMYYNELEFDSDELSIQKIDFDNITELRSNRELSIRMHNGDVREGFIILQNGQLHIVNAGIERSVALDDITSIAESRENEIDLWDGYAKFGASLSRGDTSQFAYNVEVGLQRRTTTSRFQSDYTGHYSNYVDETTETKTVSADNRRFTSLFDWFISNKVFIRAVDLEIFVDPFLNIDQRTGYSVAVGYFILDENRTHWDVVVGPSYQSTKYVAVSQGDLTVTSPGVSFTSDYCLEVTKKVDFDMQYQLQWVNEASGDFIHHFEAGFEVDLIGDLELDLTFYLDRTESPKLDETGNPPEQNDYRLALSLGYDF
jgi:hypothetical protein